MGKSLELDRRRFSRHPCTGVAEILRNGRRWCWGTVSDISRGGCYIETSQPLPTNAEAELRLTIAGVLLEIPANVASSDPMFGMGMDFVMPAEDCNKLPSIIEKIANAGLSTSVWEEETSNQETPTYVDAALQHLEEAQTKLQQANEGGQWAESLQLIENAISEAKKVGKQGSIIETSDATCRESASGWICEVR